MNNTEIKTRHGLILQALTAQALSLAGFTHVENHQYDEMSEVPDFLIPDGDAPQYMIEVHQTEARNSFQMKTLRGFTAVTEAKVHYSDDMVSVNILFGDPEREVPESNLKALCGYFDVNIVPRYAAKRRDVMETLETVSLRSAGTEDMKVVEGAQETAKECPEGLAELVDILAKDLRTASPNPALKKLWQLERKRHAQLGPPPTLGRRTYYKRNVLRSLFFTDSQFKELFTKGNSADYSKELTDQLVRCKLATLEEQIWGDELVVDVEFADFLKDPDAVRFRDLCKRSLAENDGMRWFFADIREIKRRQRMCNHVIHLVERGRQIMADAIYSDLSGTQSLPIQHDRCWIADLLPLRVDKSHNFFNRAMYQHPAYSVNLGNPFNNIAIKSERLGTNPTIARMLSEVAADIFFETLEKNKTNVSGIEIEALADDLLRFRVGSAIKLQKLNPLYLELSNVCEKTGLSISYIGTRSIISDLAGAARAVAKFDLFHITDGRLTIIANAVAVKDQNGDHKSKEWGARRRAVGYRLKNGAVKPAEFHEAVFIIDGDWESKHVERLHRAGWTRIIRLDEVEDNLRDIFSIPAEKDIDIPEERLPLAAEDDGMGMEMEDQ